MSDNAFAYRKSNAFKAQLAIHGARHIFTPPYTPRWNGKVERFIQTLKREWAYAHSWPNSVERTRALASFCATTTGVVHIAHWETGRRSAAFATSVGRTASCRQWTHRVPSSLPGAQVRRHAGFSCAESTRRASCRTAPTDHMPSFGEAAASDASSSTRL